MEDNKKKQILTHGHLIYKSYDFTHNILPYIASGAI